MSSAEILVSCIGLLAVVLLAYNIVRYILACRADKEHERRVARGGR